MSDYGRYGDDTRSRERGGFSRNSNSMFDYGSGNRDRNRDRSRGSHDRDEIGGWAGSGRTSAYDDHNRHGGRWSEERENFSWGGRGRDHDRERSRDRDRERGSGGGDQSERHYGSDDYRSGLPVDETSRLIASNKVEGTAVYGSDGNRLGSIYNFMVNKYSGRVEYAVMSYGGFLGMGQRYYPLPWRMLTYDTNEGGYRIDMMERDLRDAPSFDRDSEPRFDKRYDDHVNNYYGR